MAQLFVDARCRFTFIMLTFINSFPTPGISKRIPIRIGRSTKVCAASTRVFAAVLPSQFIRDSWSRVITHKALEAQVPRRGRLQPLATACNRPQPLATARNRSQPAATGCNRPRPAATGRNRRNRRNRILSGFEQVTRTYTVQGKRAIAYLWLRAVCCPSFSCGSEVCPELSGC